jgi:hypothetical protein
VTTEIMADWYRKLALSLLTVLIISATGQWLVWVRWSARIDEQHVQYDRIIAELRTRPTAARNAEPRISIMETQLQGVLSQLMAINGKLDRYILKKINGTEEPKIWQD